MPEPDDKPEWLSTYEAAKRVGVHPKTLLLWAREGRITAAVTPGGHRRFRVSELDALLKREAS